VPARPAHVLLLLAGPGLGGGGASGHWEDVQDKGWWGYKPDPEGFAQYLEAKVKPQLRELLTQYGPSA